ncbi:hypothetical protein LTR56_003893 [Elasticomyces elasticus]|nr:hypothetical protein LTR22_022568 [Elasticomyces elasticus]KAK3654620.1 hypothetical protein LTR56_003893 [Elasticomyces elasticus]KAK4908000.1 hypothetical protein LTR49_023031 [Elasticomyces elasticus]KAK5755248.1 hypothetical protein LTS12_014698 [Elasticomyces elasticus]
MPATEADAETRCHMAKLFNVNKVLEKIALNLDMIDLLHFQRVNKPFRDVVDSSPIVQQRLFLRADGRQNLHLLPLLGSPNPPPAKTDPKPTFRVFHWPLRHEETGALLGKCEERITIYTEPMTPDELPRCGEKVRRMLLSVPPLHEVVVKGWCCASLDCREGVEGKGTTVTNEQGVTLGEVLDAAKPLMVKCLPCPTRGKERLASDCADGKVRVSFNVVGNAQMIVKDPLNVQRMKREPEREEYYQADQARLAKKAKKAEKAKDKVKK